MERLFVDTAAWAALEIGNDPNHRRALEFRLGPGRKYAWATTNWVVWETVTLLRYRGTHAKAAQFYTRVTDSPGLEIIHVTPEYETLGWKIFQRYDDKTFGGVDCVSFAIMKTLRIKSAFTFDSDFRQAGFTLLPTSD